MKHTLRMLLVEDDKYFLQHLKEILSPFGLCEGAATWEAARDLLAVGTYDLVVTDLNLPDGPQGLEVLALAGQKRAMRLMLTSSTDEELISRAYALGAQHVLAKAQVAQHLPNYIKSVLAQKDLRSLSLLFDEKFPTKDDTLIQNITKLLTSPWQGRGLLITGPTGTGKSVLGKVLAEHLLGDKAAFVHLNCSEIPDNLIESELFGHEKGAFTGADQKKIGKLKAADGGVLFLDEVGTMSQAMQQKLLKAIEEKTFYPIGSTKQEKSSFTLMTATCEDLQQKILAGLFREDLYFRIAGLRLPLPALRERVGDIELLIRYFQKQSPRRYVLTPEALEEFNRYPWPGNIRELRQALLSLGDIGTGVVTEEHVRIALKQQQKVPTSDEFLSSTAQDFIREQGLRAYFQMVEKKVAQEALARHEGKITACIKELKISSSAFYRILHENQLSL